MQLKKYKAAGEEKIMLKDFETGAPPAVKAKKEEYLEKTALNLEEISSLQEKLYSQAREGLIIVLQAMDAAGKDGTIKHVMSGVNPQGISVISLKAPTSVELSHDFMWRISSELPERGKISIFNRSWYEDVLIVKVRKLYEDYNMAERCKKSSIIHKRYQYIKAFESHLYDESYRVVKIFLHLSKEEQKERFIERIDRKIKNWKFSSADIEERRYWDEYQEAYEDAINATATKECPWYIIPADNKWYTRYLVSEIVLNTLKKINPMYPEMPEEEQNRLAEDREKLLREN